ncbi:MAG TPA: glycosyltransferase [Gemmatimonadaceae bacterium]|nr:glycosyltransferase [Gemmatimonadaceae bacterium]
MHILWLKTELLHPVDKGGRIRTYQMLRALRHEHRITYLTLDDGTAAPDAALLASEYCHELVRIPFAAPAKGTPAFWLDLLRNGVSSLPYAVAKYRSAAMRRAIIERVAVGDVDVVVCDFLFPSINVAEGLGTPTVLFQHNVESMIWERHAAVAAHPVKRRYMRQQWRRMQRWEQAECLRFDHVVTVSEEDAAIIRDRFAARSVSSVPTGVDVEFFRPTGAVPRAPRELVFTGSMDWMPNEDAIRYLVTEVMPRLRQRFPDVTLTVVGRNPPAAVQALAADQGVTITGRVPDVRPYMERGAVFIVPIRVGGGTRLKIYEAMAMECPVVSTRVGAEGLPLDAGRHLLLADTPEELAAAIGGLLDDPARARALAVAAAEHVRTHFAWERAAADFTEACVTASVRRSGTVPAGAVA